MTRERLEELKRFWPEKNQSAFAATHTDEIRSVLDELIAEVEQLEEELKDQYRSQYGQ